MAEFAYKRLVDVSAGDQVALRESLNVGRLAMRQDLGYEEASALDRLLIDQVVLCWLRLHYVEFHHTAISNRDHWERKLSATQRRYLRACETLARVRRLRLPSMQINIGEKQLNVA